MTPPQTPESTTQSAYPGSGEYHSIGLHVHPRVPLNRLTHGGVAWKYGTVPDTREYHSIRYPATREYHSIGSHMHPRVPLDRVTYDGVSPGKPRSRYPCMLCTQHIENIRNHIQPMLLVCICKYIILYLLNVHNIPPIYMYVHVSCCLISIILNIYNAMYIHYT